MGRPGKIAALPLRIREEVNQRLADGQTGAQILPWLNTLPEVRAILADRFDGVDVSDENLSAFRNGDHQDWIREQGRVEQVRKLAEYSMRIAQATGQNMTTGAVQIAAGRIFELFEAGLYGGEDGESLTDIVSAISSLHKASVASKRLDVAQATLEQRNRQLALEEAKFQRTTAELFLQWYDDREAKKIAASESEKSVKMDSLIKLMFGERPANG